MSQEIKVVKCYNCETYQTQIAKKTKQWVCALCGEKQTLKYSYGTGSGKDCRLLVQKLNKDRMEATEVCIEECDPENDQNNDNISDNVEISNTEEPKKEKISKWQKYLDDDNNLEPI